jgi:hypothetical protein
MQVAASDLNPDVLTAVLAVENAPDPTLVGFTQVGRGIGLTSVWPASTSRPTAALLPAGVSPRQDHVVGFLAMSAQFFAIAPEVPSLEDPRKLERRLFLGFCPRSAPGTECLAPRLVASTVLLDSSEQSGLVVGPEVMWVVDTKGYRRISIASMVQRAAEQCGEFRDGI